MRTIEYHITPQQEGMSVERYLKGVHGYSSRTIVKLKHYEQGMRLNGEHTRTIDLLRAGDCLQITFLDSSEHGVEHFIRSNRRVPVVYEDEHLLLVNKPAGLVVHEDESQTPDTLIGRILRICPATNPADTQRIHWQTSLLPTATGWVWT